MGFAYYVLINWIGFRSRGGRRHHADLREDPHGQDHHPRGEQKLYEFYETFIGETSTHVRRPYYLYYLYWCSYFNFLLAQLWALSYTK